MKNVEVLRKLLAAEIPSFSFQFEKMLRRLNFDEAALLMDGINNIPQTGFAVNLQTRFLYDLEPEFGLTPPRHFFINSKFLSSINLSKKKKFVGIRIYFGVDNTGGSNKLTLILTNVVKVRFDPDNDIFTSTDVNYYIPKDSTDGDWQEISQERAKELKDNLREIKKTINNTGKGKYKIDGYFIGSDALRNVLSKSLLDEFNQTITKKGIKIYLGLGRDNMINNYEVDSKDQNGDNNEDKLGEFQLIMVGMDDPKLGPLASFRKIFATLETDIRKYVEGHEIDIPLHIELPSGGNCIKTSEKYPPTNPI
ncbi:hypothetical protein [Spirosoma sp. 48-14]|uniref:hypothetical protein n=2 Tax=unclassified Spirosoma TaxID=2621999 RepID=UPI0009677D1F|nr:hypothetical protein [Spirosoma sp. 48-14]OJW75771.1 MAG: hypothetical protein BGO59_04605 [Spirosoma sp. 48-14]